MEKFDFGYKKNFASDNWSGVSPEIMQTLTLINRGHHPSYGEDDPMLALAEAKFRELFGKDSQVFFVYNGTAANVLSVQQLLRSWEAVVTPETSHLHVDEAGAPEKFCGIKLLTVNCENGKIKPKQIEPFLESYGFQHHVQARMISISQVTELGTLYQLDEVKELADFAHKNNMFLHVDGARIANAAVALRCTFKEMITECGVDVLSFGGTKNGLMFGEAVVFLNKNLAHGFQYNRKQGMQLASKMRFITAQFITYLENDLWKRNAENANSMAKLLGNLLSDIKEVKISRPIEANGVFAVMPSGLISKLNREYFFHVWNESTNEVRLMCSFDTTEEDVKGFVFAAKRLLVHG